jgi:hypothetical protein
MLCRGIAQYIMAEHPRNYLFEGNGGKGMSQRGTQWVVGGRKTCRYVLEKCTCIPYAQLCDASPGTGRKYSRHQRSLRACEHRNHDLFGIFKLFFGCFSQISKMKVALGEDFKTGEWRFSFCDSEGRGFEPHHPPKGYIPVEMRDFFYTGAGFIENDAIFFQNNRPYIIQNLC